MRMSPSSLRIFGIALLAVGLIVTSMAYISGKTDGYIMIFPFVFGNINGLPAVALTLGTVIIYVITMFAPYYLFLREDRLTRQIVYFEDPLKSSEFTDYIITLDFPEEFRKTFFIESGDGEIQIGSRDHPFFNRKYKLPEGFEAEDYHHEFDERFLMLKLKLRKIA